MERKKSLVWITIPNQHGAWAALISCFLLGVFVAGNFNTKVVLLFVSVFFGFLARHTLSLCVRLSETDKRRQKLFLYFIFYFFVFLTLSVFLVVWYRMWFLVVLGIVGFSIGLITLILEKSKMGLSIHAEILGMLGLSLVAPAIEFASCGAVSQRTYGLWLICSLFFTGSVFHVRYLNRNKEHFKAALPTVVYHLSVCVFIIFLSYIGFLPQFSLLAFIPVTLKTLWMTTRKYKSSLPIKYVGFVELFHTIIFVLLSTFAFRFFNLH